MTAFTVIFTLLTLVGRAQAEEKVQLYVADFPPYAYLDAKDPNAQASGFFVDAVQAMAKKAGPEYAGKLDVLPWKRAQQELKQAGDQRAKLIFPLIRTEEREKNYRWVAELYVDDIVLIVPKDEPRVMESLADAKNMRIGVVGGSALLAELKEQKDIKLEVAPDIVSCAKLLNAGRIDAWYVSKWVGISTLHKLGIPATTWRVTPAFHRLSIFLGASLDTPDKVKDAWSKAFDAIKADGEYERLLKKWKKQTGAD